MSDLEKFLQDTLALPESNEWNSRIHVYSRLTLADPQEWAEAMELVRLRGAEWAARAKGIYLLAHPKRKGEWVGRVRQGEVWIEFTPQFVRECMEAARHGDNPLIGFVNNQIATL